MYIFHLLRILLGSIFIQIGPGDESAEPGMIINNGSFTINGTSITPDWKYSSFITCLGKPERVDPEAPAIDAYDSNGLMLWRERMDTAVTQLKIQFVADPEYSHHRYTTGFYTGILKIEGISISSTTTLTELKTELPQYKIEKKYGGNYGTYKEIHLFAFYDASEAQLQTLCIRNRCD